MISYYYENGGLERTRDCGICDGLLAVDGVCDDCEDQLNAIDCFLGDTSEEEYRNAVYFFNANAFRTFGVRD